MAGLLFLESGDFHIEQGVKGDILCNSIRGISLILFFSPKCVHCQNLIPIFKRLPGQLGGVQFGLINVTVETNLIKMARHTITEIKYVPLILLFVNGKPYIRFECPGQPTEQTIRSFVIEVVSKIHQKDQFIKNEKKTQSMGVKKHSSHHDDIPPLYSIGWPLKGQDEVTYLEYSEAYQK